MQAGMLSFEGVVGGAVLQDDVVQAFTTERARSSRQSKTSPSCKPITTSPLYTSGVVSARSNTLVSRQETWIHCFPRPWPLQASLLQELGILRARSSPIDILTFFPNAPKNFGLLSEDDSLIVAMGGCLAEWQAGCFSNPCEVEAKALA
jgi:hypothetical protein